MTCEDSRAQRLSPQILRLGLLQTTSSIIYLELRPTRYFRWQANCRSQGQIGQPTTPKAHKFLPDSLVWGIVLPFGWRLRIMSSPHRGKFAPLQLLLLHQTQYGPAWYGLTLSLPMLHQILIPWLSTPTLRRQYSWLPSLTFQEG